MPPNAIPIKCPSQVIGLPSSPAWNGEWLIAPRGPGPGMLATPPHRTPFAAPSVQAA